MNVDPSKVNLSEKDIEDWLWENPQAIGIDHWLARQLDVPSGRIDLLGCKVYSPKMRCPIVVEIKNVPIDSGALTQVCRYAADIKRSLYQRDDWTGEEPYALTMIIGKGSIDDRIMFEANALDIELRTFSVSFKLDVGGSYSWNEETRTRHREQYIKLSQSELFDTLIITEEPEHLEENPTDEGAN